MTNRNTSGITPIEQHELDLRLSRLRGLGGDSLWPDPRGGASFTSDEPARLGVRLEDAIAGRAAAAAGQLVDLEEWAAGFEDADRRPRLAPDGLPLVAGGQGRSAQEVTDDAVGSMCLVAIAGVAAFAFAAGAGLSWLVFGGGA
jgi:hypothetical protein